MITNRKKLCKKCRAVVRKADAKYMRIRRKKLKVEPKLTNEIKT